MEAEGQDDKPRFLLQTQAEKRDRQVRSGSIRYALTLELRKGSEFSGEVAITFESLDWSEDTFLDFNNRSVKWLRVNGSEISSVQYDGLFLTLPKEQLRAQNEVVVRFESTYATNGEGLHSFVDTDGKQYLYSQCEPYFCNKIFPSFDQPSLKAVLDLTVVAPQDWVVLSNEFPRETTQHAEQGTQTVRFDVTKLLPSYLFAVLAGPYREIRATKTHRDIPMRVLTRESLMPHLERMSDFVFEVTNESMRVFEEFFGVPYPFSKYDQIFCPEYNMGAMENAGCVTFTDIYVWKEEVDAVRRTYLAITISHELAHHWFGNLVTMKWWNDLWLNESFADFISYFCLSKCNIQVPKHR